MYLNTHLYNLLDIIKNENNNYCVIVNTKVSISGPQKDCLSE